MTIISSTLSLLLAGFSIAASTEMEASSLHRNLAEDEFPWEDLQASLPSGSEQLKSASFEQYVNECLPMFPPTNPAENRSTHFLIDQPSGLCMAVHFCIWERCSPDQPYLQSETSYLDWYANIDTVNSLDNFIAYFTAGFSEGEGSWHDPSNPWLDIPYRTLFPKTSGDVVAAVRFAKDNELELSIKNSGHSFLGSSTKRDTLLLNMNQFKRYALDDLATHGVTDCTAVETSEDILPDLSNQPCAVSAAKGKPGVIRVGGGENWDKTYRSVKAANEALPDGYRYHVVGGNSASVSPMGWTWSGGLSATTAGRKFGFGVDQVVQIEAVLPNGELVRFGPTAWEDAPGFLVPRTTAVSGVCCSNPEANEDEWIWTDCSQPINFDDLWFAFRGGGGGTWGVVTSVTLQLHEYLPFEWALPDFTNVTEAMLAVVPPVIARFELDFLVDPESIGVSRELSDACGRPNSASGTAWWCYGEGTAAGFVAAFSQFVASISEDLLAAGLSQEEIEILQTSITTVPFTDFAEAGLLQSTGTAYEGKLKDDGNNGYQANVEGQLNILVPKSWLLQNKDRFIQLSLTSPLFGANGLYYAFAGSTSISSDQASSLSTAHREAAFMFTFIDAIQVVQYNDLLQEMYDFTGTEFPAYLGANHLSPSAFGPLKSDWTTPCPYTFTRKESEELCVSGQQAVWGSETLQRLEAIKQEIDPNGMFDCFRCVGNTVSVPEPTTTNTILDVVLNSPDHTKLAESAVFAGVTDVLSDGEAELTLFAPTDSAFGMMEALLGAPLTMIGPELLAGALTYHLVSGKVMAEDVTSGPIPSVAGEIICAQVSMNGVVLNAQANITVVDIVADNGVVHVVDAVLLPNSILTLLGSPLVTCSADGPVPAPVAPDPTTAPVPEPVPAPVPAPVAPDPTAAPVPAPDSAAQNLLGSVVSTFFVGLLVPLSLLLL